MVAVKKTRTKTVALAVAVQSRDEAVELVELRRINPDAILGSRCP